MKVQINTNTLMTNMIVLGTKMNWSDVYTFLEFILTDICETWKMSPRL